MKQDKSKWIAFFTQQVATEKEKICSRYKNYKDQASAINQYINDIRDNSIRSLKANSNELSQSELLDEILIITYASYIVMLDDVILYGLMNTWLLHDVSESYGSRSANCPLNIQ